MCYCFQECGEALGKTSRLIFELFEDDGKSEGFRDCKVIYFLPKAQTKFFPNCKLELLHSLHREPVADG